MFSTNTTTAFSERYWRETSVLLATELRTVRIRDPYSIVASSPARQGAYFYPHVQYFPYELFAVYVCFASVNAQLLFSRISKHS